MSLQDDNAGGFDEATRIPEDDRPVISRYPIDPQRAKKRREWYERVEVRAEVLRVKRIREVLGASLRAIEVTETSGTVSRTTRYEF